MFAFGTLEASCNNYTVSAAVIGAKTNESEVIKSYKYVFLKNKQTNKQTNKQKLQI